MPLPVTSASVEEGAGVIGGATLVVRVAPLVLVEEDFLDFFFFSFFFTEGTIGVSWVVGW